MQIVLAAALGVMLAVVAADVAAELYRWRDPQTGTIRYSSYPPPWYGDESREATAPKVEVLGNRDAQAASRKPADEMAEKVAEVIRFMEQRREQLLSRMTVARASAGFDPAAPGFKADLQAYQSVTRELDKFDPQGAAATAQGGCAGVREPRHRDGRRVAGRVGARRRAAAAAARVARHAAARASRRQAAGRPPVSSAPALRSVFVEANGIRLHTMQAGEGPLVLFLHGFPQFWYAWRHQLAEFARDHHVVAPDLRGYNRLRQARRRRRLQGAPHRCRRARSRAPAERRRPVHAGGARLGRRGGLEPGERGARARLAPRHPQFAAPLHLLARAGAQPRAAEGERVHAEAVCAAGRGAAVGKRLCAAVELRLRRHLARVHRRRPRGLPGSLGAARRAHRQPELVPRLAAAAAERGRSGRRAPARSTPRTSWCACPRW